MMKDEIEFSTYIFFFFCILNFVLYFLLVFLQLFFVYYSLEINIRYLEISRIYRKSSI